MKLFVALFFMLSTLVNASAVCAHASGTDTAANMAMSESTMHMEHGDHGSPEKQSNHHNGCENDCDGGANCKGCIVTGVSANITQFAKAPLYASLQHLVTIYDHSAHTSAIEPPPPRA